MFNHVHFMSTDYPSFAFGAGETIFVTAGAYLYEIDYLDFGRTHFRTGNGRIPSEVFI